MKITRYYSGSKSKKFWKLINKYNDENYYLYKLGCNLQELEEKIIKILEHKLRR
jgi:hypothetical protein